MFFSCFSSIFSMSVKWCASLVSYRFNSVSAPHPVLCPEAAPFSADADTICLSPYVKCVCVCASVRVRSSGLVPCLSCQIGFVDEVPSDLPQLFIPSPRWQHLGAVLEHPPVWPSPWAGGWTLVSLTCGVVCPRQFVFSFV